LLVQDGDKYYIIDDNKVVASLSKEEFDKLQTPKENPSFGLGDRVTHRDQPGNVISVTASIYGDTIGVRFDDGSVNEFAPSQLVASETERPAFSSAVQELIYDFDQYSVLQANTLEELEIKEREARALNLRATSLIKDEKLALADRVELDKVATSTNVDSVDFKENKELLRLAENADHFNRFNQYHVDNEFHGYGSSWGSTDDASWLDDIEIISAKTEESHLASLARDTVAHLSKDQLSNDDFMNEVRDYTFDRLRPEDHDKFTLLLESAAQMRLGEFENMPKEASAEDYDDVDDSALFM